MDRLEGYALGAFGILVTGASVTGQVVAFTNGRPLIALLLALGVLCGGSLYRTGHRLASR
ncbi:MAG TPA: hypothetical protein VLE71_07000 [Actinomycetota bacterium]|nr:hypothetical protein [Actinomycetota bacterium]